MYESLDEYLCRAKTDPLCRSLNAFFQAAVNGLRPIQFTSGREYAAQVPSRLSASFPIAPSSSKVALCCLIRRSRRCSEAMPYNTTRPAHRCRGAREEFGD